MGKSEIGKCKMTKHISQMEKPELYCRVKILEGVDGVKT